MKKKVRAHTFQRNNLIKQNNKCALNIFFTSNFFLLLLLSLILFILVLVNSHFAARILSYASHECVFIVMRK